MAAKKKKSTRSSASVAFGSFLKRSKAKGAKLITATSAAVGKGGRKIPVYRVKGLPKAWFRKLGSAKTAANRLAHGR